MAEHIALCETANPFGGLRKGAARVQTSDERAQGRVGDADDLVAALFEHLGSH